MKNTKKKIACLALASALIIPGVMGLAGCEKGHTHAFNSDPFYEVITEGETKIARSWKKCSCGAEDAHKKVTNAVIVNPTTVQSALDGKIVLRDGEYIVTEKEAGENYESVNNKTIVFDEGNYNEVMFLRPSKQTVMEIYKDGQLYTGELSNTYNDYTYKANFSNITFAGIESAVIKNYIYAYNGEINTIHFPVMYDAVRELTVSTSNTKLYNSVLNFNNITITNLNFSGKYGRIFLYGVETFDHAFNIDNFSIKNCSFSTEVYDNYSGAAESNSFDAAMHIRVSHFNCLSNINISNNTVDGHYQAVGIWGAKNVTIQNNEFKNLGHNALALQSPNSFSGETVKSEGIYTIKNNTISNTTDRAIRFGQCKNINIIIENNTFNNCYEDRTDEKGAIVNNVQMNQGIQLVATGNLTADENETSSFTFKNNTVDGEIFEDAFTQTTSHNPSISTIVYVQEPTIYAE